MHAPTADRRTPPPATEPVAVPAASAPRVVFGGVLMGLANLVPGISGGTMILAVGLYDRFIGAVADVTRLRLSRATVVFLGLFALGAAAAILSCAGAASALVRDHRWAMYGLFVGMTLGGVPLLWKLCKPIGPGVIAGFVAGLGVMVAQALDLVSLALPETTVSFAVAGVAGAMSMVLPGISGAYVLLLLGVYEIVIGSLSGSALRSDLGGSLAVLVPVGVGAVLGIALLSNLLKWLIVRCSAPVHGALLGLLVGSVVGLWPFQEPAHAELADRAQRKAIQALLEGEALADVRAERALAWTDAEAAELVERWRGASGGELKVRSLERAYYAPSGARIAFTALLLAAGFALTRLVGRGGAEPERAAIRGPS